MGRGRTVTVGRRAALVVAGAVVLATTVGCTGDASPPQPAGLTSSSEGIAPLPPEVLAALRVEVRQSRTDRAARVVQVAVHNDGTTDLDVVGARLTSPTVEGAAVSEDGRRAPAGTRRDLSVALGAPVCDAGAGATPRATAAPDVAGTTGAPDTAGTSGPTGTTTTADATVRLEVVDEAGRRGTLEVAPEDPNGHLARIHGEDCAAVAVARGGTLTLGPQLATRQEPDGRWVGTVELTLAPRAGGPEIGVDAVERTVLLDPAPGGAQWTAALSTAPGGARTVRLDVVPARCDPHAVAEDKRGTAFGVHARVDGVPQHVFHVTADDDLRGLVHDFVALACGWPTS
ncbi:hypothetical protein [Cellulomonas cellasea]|uniref:Uncharacterized protein n=2 Tax=Cellulomonas cellasea TaxID=43670 RepID=A0A0A0B6P4_9CELL|nr:hypothetical protein [Cellulomonas cellasea]KGM01873.1 hypothetical protein Q760_16995 [Cellulomonas cellasea DSM 20118]GEA86506.1 hypothetical protein CCE01nite_04550 [Cellulomonas cellasea]